MKPTHWFIRSLRNTAQITGLREGQSTTRKHGFVDLKFWESSFILPWSVSCCWQKGWSVYQSNRPLEKVFICYIYWIEWKALWAHSEQYCVCFLLSVINERGQRGRIVRLFVPWLVLNESIAACLQLSCQADWLCFLLRGVSTTFLNRLFLMHRDIC